MRRIARFSRAEVNPIFYWSLNLFALLGIIANGFVQESPVAAVAAGLLYGAGYFLTEYKRYFSLNRPAENIFAGFIFMFCLYDYLFISRDVTAIGNFLLALQILRAFKRKQKFEFATVYGISFAQFVLACEIIYDLKILFFFLAYILLLPYALVSFLSRFGDFSKGNQPAPHRQIPLTRKTIVSFTFVSAIVLLLMAQVFVLLPRYNSEILKLGGLKRNKNIIDFTDKVELGDKNTVLRDPTVVARVQSDRPVYLRGKAYDFFNGIKWSEASGSESRYPVIDGSVAFLSAIPPRYHVYEQKIQLVNGSTSYLFAGYQVASISNFSEDGIFSNYLGNIRRNIRNFKPIEYTVTSIYPETSPELLRQARFTGEGDFSSRNLQVPENLTRLKALGQSLVAGKNNQYDRVNAIRDYLLQNYDYADRIVIRDRDNPIEDFLFRGKQGQCEFFATAFTLLLRSAGIPARLVTGFTPGEHNETGDYYIVRGGNAHAWTEVYFEGVAPGTAGLAPGPAGFGWLLFDATPAKPYDSKPRLIAGWLDNHLDWVNRQWYTYVIHYSEETQSGFFQTLRGGLATLGTLLLRLVASLFSSISLLWVFVIATIVALFFIRPFALITRLRTGNGSQSLNTAQSFYRKFLKYLDKSGFKRTPGMTPSEIRARLSILHPMIITELDYLIDQYYATRFGHTSLSSETALKIKHTLAVIRKQLFHR